MLLLTETQTCAEDIEDKAPEVPLIEDACMDYENEENEDNKEINDEDPPWTPEEVDKAYMKAGDDDIDQSAKPRYKENCEIKKKHTCIHVYVR